MQRRKRKRSKDILSQDAIDNNRNNPSKKRKITHYSSEPKPTNNKENISQESNKNNKPINSDNEIENDNIDVPFLSNDDIFNCDIFDENIPSPSHSATDEIINTICNNNTNNTTEYSDGVWSILVPTNKNNISVLITCDTFRIGRDEINDLQLSNMCISAAHCCITNNRIRDKILIVDDSKNGTFIGDNKLERNKEYILKNGNYISLTKTKQYKYYFFMLKYFEQNETNNNNGNGYEFNVRLNKIDSNFILNINEKETVYDEMIYNKKRLSERIGKLEGIEFDIPLSIGELIVDYYGFDIMDIIAYHIGSERPTQRSDRPVLIRSNTMCGSPIPGLTQECSQYE